jgi:5-methylcytosine-specific restriction endonuclease McrA
VLRRFGNWKKALIAANDLADHDAEAPLVVSKRRTPISVHRRFRIFKRDNYECRICHRTEEPLEVDQIVPVCHGGTDELDNLQTLCWDCNRGKGGNLQ